MHAFAHAYMERHTVVLLLLRDVAAVSAAADFNARRHLAKGR